MGDDNRRATFREPLKRGFHFGLGRGVERGGGFV